MTERPMVLVGLDHQGVLAGLARRSAPQRVPATFAASLRQTLSVLDDVMHPSGITPVSDTPSPFGPLIVAPFDRQWHFRRCDEWLATSDHLEVRVFRDEEWVKLAVVITHTAFDFGPLGKTTTSIGFDKTLSYKEYTQVRGSVFFNEAELTQVVPSIFKTPTALVKTPTALVKVDYSIKTSAGLDTVVIKNAMDMMDMLTERLALAHIKRPLGVTFSLSSELIPYQTKTKTTLLKAKHPKTKLSKANPPKNKRSHSLRWRPYPLAACASPSVVPPFLEI
jgi:hypothetical protein